MSSKSVLVTVGTTQFEKLIIETSKPQFIKVLNQANYANVVYQIGRGKYIPQGNYFRLVPDIIKYFDNADLIITHGGAGTLLQCLDMDKKIISVVNQSLAGNHQKQIVSKLSSQGYILGLLSLQQFRRNNYQSIRNFKKYKHQCQPILNKIVFGQKYE